MKEGFHFGILLYSAAWKEAIDISRDSMNLSDPALSSRNMKQYRHSDYITMEFQNKEMNLY